MAQENYTILPIMGIDVSGNNTLSATATTNTIGLSLNPITTVAAASPAVTVTVPSTVNFSIGQWVTIAGVAATVDGITAANLNISAQITAIGTSTISYNAGGNATAGAVSGGGSVVTLATVAVPTDFSPGDRVVGKDGTERMLVKCELGSNPAGSANIAQNQVVLIDSTGRAQPITTALATIAAANGSPAWTIAISPMAITWNAITPGYGWVITRGPCQFLVSAATAVGTPVYTTATAGQLSTAQGGGQTLVLGLMATTPTTAAGTCLGNAANPVLGLSHAGTL